MVGSQPSHTEQVSKVELPAWVDKAGQENYDFAKKVADRPLIQYSGDMVADPSTATKMAQGLVQNNVGSSQGNYDMASSLFGQAAGLTDPSKVDSYMSPYTTDVVNAAISDANRNLDQSLMKNADAFHSAGAFGGSRQAVARGVAEAENAKNVGSLSAGLRDQAFKQAQGAAAADASNKLNAGGGLVSAGDSSEASKIKDFLGLSQAGQQEQKQSQSEINAKVQQFLEKQNYPMTQLNTRLSALGMSPYGKTQTTDTTRTGGSPGFDPFTGGLGILSLLMSL